MATPFVGETSHPSGCPHVGGVQSGPVNDTDHADHPHDDDAVGLDTDEGASSSEPEEVTVEQRSSSPYRTPAFAAARAVVVLAVAVVGYQAIVPTTHVIRTRLARLTVSTPGIPAYNGKPASASEQPAAQTQLKTVIAAAKQAPAATGAYAVLWQPSQSSFAGLAIFLLPTKAQAAATLSELRTQQLATGANASNGLTRRSTFTVSGIPGSGGAVFTPTTASSASPTTLAISVSQYGKVVAVSEVASATHAQTDATTLAVNEFAHLRQVEPGFTLKVVRRPLEGTALWAAATLALVIIVAFGPIAWKRMARRRQQRIEEELSRRLVVHGQIITKHRR